MKKAIETKQKIFMAAVDCFSEIGYTQCTMKHIANSIGHVAANIYNYYDSKEAILLDICEYYKQHFNLYRTPSEVIINQIGKKPLADLFRMMFYTFGQDEERGLMIKLSKIIIDLKIEMPEVSKLHHYCFFDEPMAYIVKIFRYMIDNKVVRDFDYNAFAYQMIAFAYFVYIDLITDSLSNAEIDKKYTAGIDMLTVFFEYYLFRDSPE